MVIKIISKFFRERLDTWRALYTVKLCVQKLQIHAEHMI